MANIREFFVKLPFLCEAANAGRWSKINAAQFDDEAEGGTILDRVDADLDNPINRLDTAFGFMAFGCNAAKTLHCRNLAELIMLAHYHIEHGENQHNKRIDELWAAVAEKEDLYPDVTKIISADAAAADGGW
ncbi:MAG: hypothetical protein ACOYB0_09650 [Polynucleobacter sp.]